MKKLVSLKSVFVVAVLLGLSTLFVHLELQRFADIERLQSLVQQNYWLALLLYFAVVVVVATASVPGIGPLTVSAGLLFGLVVGTVAVSFATAIGATLGMLISRFLFRDWAERRFQHFMHEMDERIDQDGGLYLFSLRMIPVIPFFVISPVFGLSRMPAWKFYVITQLGLLPVLAIYVNLGTSIAGLDEFSVRSVLSPSIVCTLLLLVAVPVLTKKLLLPLLDKIRARHLRAELDD
ncbi:TVP38/TMEM64 family protein [Agaribacterium haliotis]|uniref:TVP38/TMEM64 family protein n=1 Tax=Agaribacterium haliotis TaxID=2013869 RepID=UPI0013046F76|nr:TVP38/TMEM64 family protein [Agaribacterium haliotis]